MPSLNDLHRAVESVLATRRIGQPVFVRYQLRATVPIEESVLLLAALASVVRDWFGQPLEELHAIGAAPAALLLRFAGGATAFLSLASSEAQPSVDLIVLGNHGAIYHQAALDSLDGAACGDVELVQWIERALKEAAP